MGRFSSLPAGTGCRILVSVIMVVCLSLPIAGTDRLIHGALAQSTKSVFFELNGHGVRPGDESGLGEFLTLLRNDPGLVIVIDGYSDITGEEQYNLNLSRMRAESVRKFYVGHGIAPERIKSRGNGKTDKFDSGVDEESLRMNRRAVITLESATVRETPLAETTVTQTAAEKQAVTSEADIPEEIIEEGAVVEDAPQADPTEEPRMQAAAARSAPTPDLEKAIRGSMKKIAPGRVVFDVPSAMSVGETYEVEVNLSYSFLQGLSETLRGMSGEGFDNVRLGQSVGLSLNGGGFDIRPVTESGGVEEVFPVEDTGITKLVTENSSPRWSWKVTPLASGYKSLLLSVEIIAEDADYNETVDRYPLFQRVIDVKPNFIYTLSRSYWLMVVFIITVVAVVGWILIKKIRLD